MGKNDCEASVMVAAEEVAVAQEWVGDENPHIDKLALALALEEA